MSAAERVAKYKTIVYASNRHAGLGTLVTVYASNKQGAVNRAIAIGWSGHSEDARVTVQSVDDVPPTTDATVQQVRAALDELVTHGDLTPSGRSVLKSILGGDS